MVGAAHFLAENSTYLLFVPRTYCNTITTPSCAHKEEQRCKDHGTRIHFFGPFYAYQRVLCLSPQSTKIGLLMLISKRMLFYAYQQANAVLCLSARFMLISWRIWRLMLIGVWKIVEIRFTRNDPFFERGLSGLSSFSRQIK